MSGSLKLFVPLESTPKSFYSTSHRNAHKNKNKTFYYVHIRLTHVWMNEWMVFKAVHPEFEHYSTPMLKRVNWTRRVACLNGVFTLMDFRWLSGVNTLERFFTDISVPEKGLFIDWICMLLPGTLTSNAILFKTLLRSFRASLGCK